MMQNTGTDMILQGPIVTEKATELSNSLNKFTFRVARDANKYQITEAVQQHYKVKVTQVHTFVVPGKLKRRGRHVGRKPNWKKAIVTLKQGDTIDFFATE